MKLLKQTKRPLWLWIVVVLAVLAVGVSVYGVFHGREIANTIAVVTMKKEQFPTYKAGELTAAQEKLIAIIKTEYDTQPPGTKYADGVSESWCADFVSWVMKQDERPFVNPNSGSWRIPGTHTLKDYFESKGNWHPYGDGYQPKIGDVAIYDGNGPYGQHTNFIMRNDNGLLTTVGGNEAGAIHVQQHQLNDSLKAVGFAEL